MKVKILGSGQDEGIPRLDCNCPQCKKGIFRYGPSVLLMPKNGNRKILIDVPPDIKRMVGLNPIDSIFLTHAHIGHYGGLFFLGKEAYNADEKPVYCSEKMKEWLGSGNKAYRHLIERNNIQLIPFKPGEKFELDSLGCKPIKVNHRNEDADTVSLMFVENGNKFYYMPDLDHWTKKTEGLVIESDVALIDGTFFSSEEIDREDVPHPFVKETMERFEGSGTEIYFTHLNHTNPVADKETKEYKKVIEEGFGVAEDGLSLII